MFNDNYGVVNAILNALGAGRIAWLSSPNWALPSLIPYHAVASGRLCMVVYLAALQSIPLMLRGGADRRGLRLAPVSPRHVATAETGHVPAVDSQHHLLLPRFRSDLCDDRRRPGLPQPRYLCNIFQSAFMTSEMGYASAMGIALYVLILLFTVLQWQASRQTENVM
jgi:hypothetical protein